MNATANRTGRMALAGLVVGGAALASAGLGSDYACTVLGFVPGPGAAFGAPEDALDAPEGEGPFAGSLDVYTLGAGGSLTLEMGTPFFDGPGVDLIVCENPFFVGAGTFSETMYVEVSSDDSHFTRIPNSYLGDPGPFPPFETCPPEWYEGLAGVMPVNAGGSFGADPLDVVGAGGDAFDLAVLAGHPDVSAGLLDLDVLTSVRLVDVVAGQDVDSAGNGIWDHGLDATASADLDAVVAVNNGFNQWPGRPAVEMTLAGQFLTIRLHDADGFNDIKFGLKASANGVVVDMYALIPFFLVVPVDAQTVDLITGPIPKGVYNAVLKVSAVDSQLLTGGDVVHIR